MNSDEIVHSYIHKLKTEPIITPTHILFSDFMEMSIPEMLQLQQQFIESINGTLVSLIHECIDFWNENTEKAVMDIPIASSISTLFSLISASFISSYRMDEPETYLMKASLFCTFWAFASAFPSECRNELAAKLTKKFPKLSPDGSLLLFTISPEAEDRVSVEQNQEQQEAETQITCELIQMCFMRKQWRW